MVTEGRTTQTLREGPSWRLTPTAGKLESFIESFKCAVWSLAWGLRGLSPPGDLLPSSGMDRRTDRGWDFCQTSLWLVPFSGCGGRQVGRGMGSRGGTCCRGLKGLGAGDLC